jgi:Fe-S cluster assembly ATPase SufC
LKFTRLRLSGFKSFVDPTELFIEPGLTGVVGPNGCGKSNLLEALRWVMGENRPTSMRGSGMDDVIFGGTGSRPMRNNAEVTLFIDNHDRSAPAPYNECEVSRDHAAHRARGGLRLSHQRPRSAASAMCRFSSRMHRRLGVPCACAPRADCDPDQSEAARTPRHS